MSQAKPLPNEPARAQLSRLELTCQQWASPYMVSLLPLSSRDSRPSLSSLALGLALCTLAGSLSPPLAGLEHPLALPPPSLARSLPGPLPPQLTRSLLP